MFDIWELRIIHDILSFTHPVESANVFEFDVCKDIAYPKYNIRNNTLDGWQV